MTFDYSFYHRHEFVNRIVLAIVLAAVIAFFLWAMVFFELPFLAIAVSVLFFLFIVNAVWFFEGGVWLFREKEKDAVAFSGIVEDVVPGNLFGKRYTGVYENWRNYGKCETVVLDGKPYRIMSYGNLRPGDSVCAKVLPKSKFVLLLNKIPTEATLHTFAELESNPLPNDCVMRFGEKMTFDYVLYRKNVFHSICLFFLIAAAVAFLIVGRNIIGSGTTGGFLFVLSPLAAYAVMRLIHSNPLLLAEKEKNAVSVSGTIERTEQSKMPVRLYSTSRNGGKGETVVIGGTKYRLISYGTLCPGDPVSAKVLPKSKFVLQIEKVSL